MNKNTAQGWALSSAGRGGECPIRGCVLSVDGCNYSAYTNRIGDNLFDRSFTYLMQVAVGNEQMDSAKAYEIIGMLYASSVRVNRQNNNK